MGKGERKSKLLRSPPPPPMPGSPPRRQDTEISPTKSKILTSTHYTSMEASTSSNSSSSSVSSISSEDSSSESDSSTSTGSSSDGRGNRRRRRRKLSGLFGALFSHKATRDIVKSMWTFFPVIFIFLLLVRLILHGASGSAYPDGVVYYRDDGGIVYSNHTVVFPNGTLLFYNGSVFFPNGTYLHKKPVLYEDLAECSASRLTKDAVALMESYLEGEIGLDMEQPLPSFCGITAEENAMYRSWSGMIASSAPILYPKTTDELRDYVRRIGDAGCKIRPIGSKHSESGIAITALEDMTVGISLAKFSLDIESNWSLAMPNEHVLEQGRIRAEAGHSLLKVNSVIRTKDLFFPTLPDNWAITVGSMVSTMVHGAGFGKTYLNGYVTRLLVMYGDGSIGEVEHPADLAMWRNSMGLIGLILSAEIQLEHREFFSMGTRQTVVQSWNPWYLDTVLSSLLPGSAGTQFLFDPWTDELIGVGYVAQNPVSKMQRFFTAATSASSSSQPRFTSDAECTFDIQSLSCSYPEFCEYRFQFGDILPAQSCRLKRKANPDKMTVQDAYAHLQPLMEQAAVDGLPTPEAGSVKAWWNVNHQREMHFSGQQQNDAEAQQTWMDDLSRTVHEARERLNDGFWTLGARKSISMEYVFPLSKLFQAVDIHRSFVRELVINNAPFQFRDAPLQFQFFRINPDQIMLQPKRAPPGEYVAIKVQVNCHNNEGGEVGTAWRIALAELESRWVNAFEDEPMFPLVSSVFGFHVFSTHPSHKEEESLKAKYRRVRRVRDAFRRVKTFYESHWERPRSRLGSLFGSGSGPTYEEVYGVEDPSYELFSDLQHEITLAETSEEYHRRQALHDKVFELVDKEVEYYGDLQRDLLQEAYDNEKEASLPLPFSNPKVLHGVFDEEQALEFLKYRQTFDPENRFWGGGAIKLFSKRAKESASRLDDVDLLESSFLVLKIKTFAKIIQENKDMKTNSLISVFIITFVCAGLSMLVHRVCNKRQRRKGGRRRGGSLESSDDSSISSETEDTSDSSSSSSSSSE